MRLTTKARYAGTAMLDLAFHSSEGPVALVDISGRQGISLSYLEQLFSRIRRAGIVKSTRGASGGYSLDQSPCEITLASIICAVDETVDARGCGGGESCSGEIRCLMHNVWTELSDHVHSFLADITLQDLLDRQSIRAISSKRDEMLLKQIKLDN